MVSGGYDVLTGCDGGATNCGGEIGGCAARWTDPGCGGGGGGGPGAHLPVGGGGSGRSQEESSAQGGALPQGD